MSEFLQLALLRKSKSKQLQCSIALKPYTNYPPRLNLGSGGKSRLSVPPTGKIRNMKKPENKYIFWNCYTKI